MRKPTFSLKLLFCIVAWFAICCLVYKTRPVVTIELSRHLLSLTILLASLSVTESPVAILAAGSLGAILGEYLLVFEI